MAIIGSIYRIAGWYYEGERFREKTIDLMFKAAAKISEEVVKSDGCARKVVIENPTFERDGLFKKTGVGRIFLVINGDVVKLVYISELVGKKIYINIANIEDAQPRIATYLMLGCH